jgi:hypothetical protein
MTERPTPLHSLTTHPSTLLAFLDAAAGLWAQAPSLVPIHSKKWVADSRSSSPATHSDLLLKLPTPTYLPYLLDHH